MLAELFSQELAPAVGVFGLALGVLGFTLTVWGLRLTYLQAREARAAAKAAVSAADAAADAVTSFRFKLDRYSAYRDLSEAEFAMEACKQHLEIPTWEHASRSYEIARRAMIRVYQGSPELTPDLINRLRAITEHISAFCTKVDAARAGKGTFPNPNKVISTIRENYEVMLAVKLSLEKDILK